MARTTLKLGSNATAWTEGVRHGRLLYPDGHEVPVLVRPSALESSPGTLHDAREDAALVGHVGHPGVLPIEQVVGVHGRISRVYAHFDGVSLPRLVETLRARGHAVPVRVAVEIAAAVAGVLQPAVETHGTGEAVAAPDPLGVDVLIGSQGQIRLAGLRVVAGGAGDARASSAAISIAWLVAELLGGERPAPGSAKAEAALAKIVELGANAGLVRALGEVLLVGGAAESGPGALATVLLALAPQQPGPSLAAWAPASISLAMRDANAAGGPLPAESGARPDPSRPVTPSMPLPEASAAYARPSPVPAPGGGVAEGGGPPSAPFLALPAEESIDFTLPGTPLAPEVRAALEVVAPPAVVTPPVVPSPPAAAPPPLAPVAARGAASTPAPTTGPRMQMLLPDGDDDVEATMIGELRPVADPVVVPPPARNDDPFEISTIGVLPTGPVQPSRWDSLGDALQTPPAPPPVAAPAKDPLRKVAVAAAAVALLAVGWAVRVLSTDDDAPAPTEPSVADAPTTVTPPPEAAPTDPAPPAAKDAAPPAPPATAASSDAPSTPPTPAPPTTVWATPSPQPPPTAAPAATRSASSERERDTDRTERREKAERTARAEREAAEKAAADKTAAEKAARERAAADKAAREKTEREAAEKAAADKAAADKAAADKAAREKAEREKARAAAAPAPAEAPAAAAAGPFKVTFRAGNDLVTKLSVTCNKMARPVISEDGAVTLPDVPRGPCTVLGIIPGTTPRRTNVVATSDATFTCFKGDSNTCAP
jgi:hypothetical protein